MYTYKNPSDLLPNATSTSLGAVKINTSSLQINSDGELSAYRDAFYATNEDNLPTDLREGSLVIVSNSKDIIGYIERPIITSPLNDSSISAALNSLQITSSTFTTNLQSDTHYASRFRLTSDYLGTNTLFDSGILTSSETKLSYTLVFSSSTYQLVAGSHFYISCKYYGSVLGESSWSLPVKVNVLSSISTPVFTAPSQAATINSNTITIGLSNFSAESGITHVSTDYKITSDQYGDTILYSNLNDTTHLLTYEFTNLVMNYGATYYIHTRFNGSNNTHSAWSTIYVKFWKSGRALYRHSSGMGTVMEYKKNNTINKVLILDAQYRIGSKAWNVYGIDTELGNYSSTNAYGTWYVNGSSTSVTQEECSHLTDDQINYIWKTSLDANTSTQNCDVWMTYKDTTDIRGAKGCPAVEYARSILVDGEGCSVPTIDLLIRMFCDADAIDSLDPTVLTYPSMALGSINPNGPWKIGGNSYCWSSTEYSSSYVRGVRSSGSCDYYDKYGSYSVAPVKDLT